MDFVYGVASEVGPGVRRIVADNPGPFTFKGTNTYLVGDREVAVIDPGPDDAGHRSAIIATLDAMGAGASAILVTHRHLDHVAGVPELARALSAPTYAFRGADADATGRSVSPSGERFKDAAFRPDVELADGDEVEGDDWRLVAIHTPGHAPDHLCFGLAGTGVMFSGDHVMGWSTSVIAPPEGNMSDYLRSLERLTGQPAEVYFPGHGGRITSPERVVKAFLIHRRWREAAILECVRSGMTTISEIVKTLYPTIDASVSSAACLSVLAHLERLRARADVACDGKPGLESVFSST